MTVQKKSELYNQTLKYVLNKILKEYIKHHALDSKRSSIKITKGNHGNNILNIAIGDNIDNGLIKSEYMTDYNGYPDGYATNLYIYLGATISLTIYRSGIKNQTFGTYKDPLFNQSLKLFDGFTADDLLSHRALIKPVKQALDETIIKPIIKAIELLTTSPEKLNLSVYCKNLSDTSAPLNTVDLHDVKTLLNEKLEIPHVKIKLDEY